MVDQVKLNNADMICHLMKVAIILSQIHLYRTSFLKSHN